MESTLPRANDTDVPTRSIIAVELSNGISDKDVQTVDPKNFVVTGDLTVGSYSGSLVLARRSRLTRGMTVEQFKADQAANPDTTTDTTSTDTTDDAGGKVIKFKKKSKDTVVFLLADGASFKPGELVKVNVRGRVRANGSPITHDKTFTFRVKGNSGAAGELRVTSTEPLDGATLVAARPRLTAEFNRAVKKDGLAAAFSLRGSQSGVHVGGETFFPRTSGTDQILQVGRRLAADDAFLPGETVTLSLSSEITEAGAAAGQTAQKLSAYVAELQVASGAVRGGWSAAAPPSQPPGPARAVVAADFLPKVSGVELVVVTESTASLYFLLADRTWSRRDSPLPSTGSGELHLQAAAAFDTEGAGLPYLVLLFSGAQGSRITALKPSEDGSLSETGVPSSLPVTGARLLGVRDLDGNGKPELVLSHDSVAVPATSTTRAGRSGRLSFLALDLVPPDPSQIDISNPDTAKPKPTFVPTYDPLGGGDLPLQILFSDLNADGKLDLVVETAGAVTLHRNISAPSQRFAFRRTGELLGRSGQLAGPRAIAALDLDGDGDIDLVAWDAEGPLFYESFLSDDAGSPLGLLGTPRAPAPISTLPVLADRSSVRVLELDGQDAPDLVIVGSSGASLLRGHRGVEATFTSEPLPLFDSAAPLAIADLDDDFGLDLATASSTTAELRLLLSEQVDAPITAEQSSFAFDTDGGLTDLSGTVLRVAVVGDLMETFSGYAVALDYTEGALTYEGFEVPEAFASLATYTLCPDARLQGCAGNASAKAVYDRGIRGAPSANVHLGTFLFRRKAVTEAVTARIELKAFSGTNNTTFPNQVTVVDGSATLEVPALIAGGVITLTVSPPAPPGLEVECVTVSRGDTDLEGLVSWSSPAGTVFAEHRVTVGDSAPVTLPGTATSYQFTTTQAGRIPVTVVGTDGAGKTSTASCEVIGLHRPVVTCVVVTAGSQHRVSWSLDHLTSKPVDRFNIYRNGIKLSQTADGTVTETLDNSPPRDGASNYEVAAVLGGVEGPTGSCAGGAIGDPDPGVTLPPRNLELTLGPRLRAFDPLTLRSSWANGEGYERIIFRIDRVGDAQPIVNQDLEGTRHDFIQTGDLSRGGVKPGQYSFTVSGRVGTRTSDPQTSAVLNVPVPVLDIAPVCSPTSNGGVEIVWSQVWQGYSALKLVVEHRVDGNLEGQPVEIPLDLADTKKTVADLTPVGVYKFRIVAAYTESLPPVLTPAAGSLERSCELSYSPRILLGTVETGVGLPEAEIPVAAEVFGNVQGFRFELEYPAFLEIAVPTGLRLDVPGAVIDEFSIHDGATSATKRVIVSVSGVDLPADQDGDGKADGKIPLARLVGAVPLDFNLPRESDLKLVNLATLNFAGAGNQVVPLGDPTKLLVRRRFVIVDRATVPAGSAESVTLAVRTTFNAPAFTSSYRITSFQLHLTWDPKQLELLPVSLDDQKQTVLFNESSGKVAGFYQLPDAATLALGNQTGDLRVAWLGFDLTNPTAPPSFLLPGVDQKILITRFRSRLAGDQPAQRADVKFVSVPRAGVENDLVTALFPEVASPSEKSLEGFFPGGLTITSSSTPLNLTSIAPAQGSLLGGGEAVLSGTGFRPGGSVPQDLAIRFLRPAGAQNPTALPVAEILSVDQNAIRFKVPDSSLRAPSSQTTPVDIELTLGGAVRKLPAAYNYELVRIASVDKTSVAAAGGETLTLRGAGLDARAAVVFKVDGVAGNFAATVTQASSDGTRLFVLTPDLRGQEGKQATVQVTLPEIAPVTFGGKITIQTSGGGPTLELDSLQPETATICGGTLVTLNGSGFTPGLLVRFGTVLASSVEVLDGSSARVATPSMPEGTGVVTVSVEVAGKSAQLTNGFTFQHPAPTFRRGDVNENGDIDVADATLLSDLILGKSTLFPENLDALDANDDGTISGGDVVAILNRLFGGAGVLPPPSNPAGFDPTPDSITSCGN